MTTKAEAERQVAEAYYRMRGELLALGLPGRALWAAAVLYAKVATRLRLSGWRWRRAL